MVDCSMPTVFLMDIEQCWKPRMPSVGLETACQFNSVSNVEGPIHCVILCSGSTMICALWMFLCEWVLFLSFQGW